MPNTSSCCSALMFKQGGVHSFAQALARPLTTIFGRSFDKAGDEFHPTLLNKIAAVALIIFLAPIVLPAISLGLLILSLSSAHKEQFAPNMKPKTPLSFDELSTEADSSASTSAAGSVVNPEGLLPAQRETLLRAYTILKNLLINSSTEWAQKSGREMNLDVIRTELETSFANGAIMSFVTRAKSAHTFHKIDLTDINALLEKLGQKAIETSARVRRDSREYPDLLRSRIATTP